VKTTLKILAATCFLALVVTLPYISANPNDSPKPTETKSASAAVKNWNLPEGFTADDAYKANCARCHAEVPKMGPRLTRTVINHMRVRANLTRDEAEAIFDYLTK